MRRFAFVIHPIRYDDFARKYKFTRYLPKLWVENAFKHVNPLIAAHVSGVRSTATDEELQGWLIALTMTPRVLLDSPYPFVLNKLEKAGKLAESLGAEILGLGAFTKIVGDRGLSLANRLHIPVTTGNSYTTATAVEGALRAADRLGIDLAQATVTVIGATGSIGRAATMRLAGQVGRLILCARRQEALSDLAEKVRSLGQAEVMVTGSVAEAVAEAEIVIAVAAAQEAIVEPKHLRPGSVFCDVARPRTLSGVVQRERPDVLVIDGGVIQVPGESADMGMDFGFPPKMVEACMAETMILALEGRLEPFTLGPEIAPEKVGEIHQLGTRHGFQLAGFRRFERAIDDREVETIRQLAAKSSP